MSCLVTDHSWSLSYRIHNVQSITPPPLHINDKKLELTVTEYKIFYWCRLFNPYHLVWVVGNWLLQKWLKFLKNIQVLLRQGIRSFSENNFRFWKIKNLNSQLNHYNQRYAIITSGSLESCWFVYIHHFLGFIWFKKILEKRAFRNGVGRYNRPTFSSTP